MKTGRFLQLCGSACLIIVVLTHIAEAFHIFPAMGWGLPDSAGHYAGARNARLRARSPLNSDVAPWSLYGSALMETALKPNLRPSSFNAARNERMASACALPIVDLPHNDTPDTPALPTAKIGGYDLY
jgi:hypothetical protein